MDRAVHLGPAWQSPAAMPRRWLVAVFAVSGIYAGLVALLSSDSVHRLWGGMAACGYVAAVLVTLAWKSRGKDAALAVSFCGGLLLPLCWLVAHSLEQPEVAVVARSGASLVHNGTPYAGAGALAATSDPNAYNPYLPVMALFGVPRALADSPLTDPRIWFGLVFMVVFWLALRRAGARDPARWTVLVTACPVIAFNLATGGDDVPLVAFLCLGFAYLWSHPPVRGTGDGESPVSERIDGGSSLLGQAGPVKAGAALGIAAAIKATAWPAVVVAIVLLAARDGRQAAGKFTLTAAAVVVAAVGPFTVHPKALIENTILFPLGLAHIISQAASPLPGHLIADTGHTGHTIVVTLLALTGFGVAVWLVFRPPRTVPRAMIVLVVAMTLMFLLAPSTRYGYFIYPLTLLIWLLAVMARQRVAAITVTPGPGGPSASSSTSPQTSPASPPTA
jgi:hypothetical protein